MTNSIAVIGVPSAPPVQTINIPIPSDPLAVVLLVLFAIDEVLPFLGGRFKRFNGVLQSLSVVLRAIKPLRSEDEAIEQLRVELEELKKQVAKPRVTRSRSDGA
jgi:hypothetical protein